MLLAPLRGLLGRAPSALELVTQIRLEVNRRWPAGAEPVDLAPIHAETLAVVFNVGPGTGPLGRGDRASRRAVAADAYFTVASWWPEPAPDGPGQAAHLAERQL